MSYNTIYQCANDQAFNSRVVACLAQEGAENPTEVANSLRWSIASASDIEAAYESAVLNENPNPGGDPSVIPDAMILSKVQSLIPPEE